MPLERIAKFSQLYRIFIRNVSGEDEEKKTFGRDFMFVYANWQWCDDGFRIVLLVFRHFATQKNFHNNLHH